MLLAGRCAVSNWIFREGSVKVRLKQTSAGGEATWGKSITDKGPMGKAPDLSKQDSGRVR